MSAFDDVNSGIQIANSLLTLAPAILALIKAVENLFPPNSGPQKKEVVLAALPEDAQTQIAASQFIDIVVTQKNLADNQTPPAKAK